jgi:NAD(P)-dependent dehydrogenase (short-subunit alcohol dehydrogenase family)
MAASAKPVTAKHSEIASTMPPNPDQTSRLLDAFHTMEHEALVVLARKEKWFHNRRLQGIDIGPWVYENNLPQSYHLFPTCENWDDTLGVNLLALFFLAQGLLPELEKAAGSVINISSIHARLTKKDFVAYDNSKAAISGMTRAMAVDLGPRVRVNSIEPAAIETDMLKAGFERKDDRCLQLKACHSTRGIGRPEEVARLALAMASGEMLFLHGARKRFRISSPTFTRRNCSPYGRWNVGRLLVTAYQPRGGIAGIAPCLHDPD